MKTVSETASLRRAGFGGAAFSVLIGLAVWVSPGAGTWLKAVSFDTLFLFRDRAPAHEVVIVAMDEESHTRLGQSPDRLWDRARHTELLEKLMTQGARGVVFDVVFAEAWSDPQVDTRLAEALRRATNRVVLAASLMSFEEPAGAGGARVLQPAERLASAAPWGVVELPRDPDGALRRHAAFPAHTSLAWKAAETFGVALPEPGRSRWIHYHGPRAFRQVSYWQALQPETLAPDVFSNKIVFVGQSRVITPRGANSGDEYPTTQTRWTGERLSGVEIQATAFLNLIRRDWLEEVPTLVEAILFIVCGGLCGFGLAQVRPLPALGWAAVGALLVVVGALAVSALGKVWFPWLIMSGVQVPVALAWSVLGFVRRATQTRFVPDHTLLRCIGQGAFGEVWLARDAIGGFHAVKIVERKKFPTADPFEREFHGMQSFAPWSRSHPGLVHILHVGRNDLGGCFYYVMEAADDEASGANIEPDRYAPRTLAREVARRGRLSVRECVELGLQLTSALDHLHQRQLIHCDIKPANIIFVNGQPKLADVGLVTTVRGKNEEITRIGTAGFLAPEGPGTAAADVFALGKTLYEAATGCECGQFPELPTGLDTSPDADSLLRLHEILLTACETDPADRYPSAASMRDDLLELQRTLAPAIPRTA